MKRALVLSSGLALAASCGTFTAADNGPTSLDAGGDAPVPSEAGAVDGSAPACAADFCSGFDTEPADTWKNVGNLNASTLSRMPFPPARSEPNVLRTVVPKGTYDNAVNALRHAFAVTSPQRVHIEFSLRVVQAPVGAPFYLASFGWGTVPDDPNLDRISEMQLMLEGSALYAFWSEDVDGGADVADKGELVALRQNEWVPVAFDIEFEPPRGVKISATIDGKQSMAGRAHTALAEFNDFDLVVGLGNIYGTLDLGGTFDIDDVRVDFTP